MKSLNLLAAVLVIAWVLWWPHKPKPDATQLRREQAIAEHRVTLAMTRDEVTRSLGVPDGTMITADGNTVWAWEAGRWVMFIGRALVDSGYFDARGNLTHDPSQQTAVHDISVATKTPKPGDWMKKFGHTTLDQPHR